MYAADDTGVFSFECIELRDGTKAVAVPNLSKSIKCTREEIRLMEREAGKDPEGFAKRFGGVGKGMDANGRPIVHKPKTALFLD